MKIANKIHNHDTNANVSTRILKGFDDNTFGEQQWTKLLQTGDTRTVNLTWQWQRSWWRSFARGRLMLIVAEQDGKPVALAPLFTDGGMVYNICPEDCLDFIGDVSQPEVIDALLKTAKAEVNNFAGFQFYFIPDTSRTSEFLEMAAERLRLNWYNEGKLPSPAMDLAGKPDITIAATRKKSLVRHENYFLREGKLEVYHATDAAGILPYLDEFFEQHIGRRNVTSAHSLFIDPKQQEYYRRLTQDIAPTGWLRFTRLKWNGDHIAFHFGLSYKGRYLFGIPSFDIRLSHHSPGEVLLRQVLLAAIAEGATTFDFGIGDEAYKYRFATDTTLLYTWGLYPR